MRMRILAIAILVSVAWQGASADEPVRLGDADVRASFAYDPAYWKEVIPDAQPIARLAVAFTRDLQFVAQCTMQAATFEGSFSGYSLHKHREEITNYLMRSLTSGLKDGRLLLSEPAWVGGQEAIRLKRSFSADRNGIAVPMRSDGLFTLSASRDLMLECVSVESAERDPVLRDLLHGQIKMILKSLKVAPIPSDAGLERQRRSLAGHVWKVGLPT
jgi:hypothetical protein